MTLVVKQSGDATARVALTGVGSVSSRLSFPSGSTAEWITVFKSANETVNGSSTLQADDHLTFTVNDGTWVAFRGQLNFTSDLTPDFKYDINIVSGSATFFQCAHWAAPATIGTSSFTPIETADAVNIVQAITGSGGFGTAFFSGVTQNNSGASLQFQIRWAQNTNNASDTIVYAGSYLEYRAVA